MNFDIGSKPPTLPAVAATPPAASERNIPSVAQFAINQQLAARAPQAAKPETTQGPAAPKPDVKGLEVSLKSVTIFKDPSSGQYVTIFRDQNTGEVREQIPDERALEFYARVARELHHAGTPPDFVNVEA